MLVQNNVQAIQDLPETIDNSQLVHLCLFHLSYHIVNMTADVHNQLSRLLIHWWPFLRHLVLYVTLSRGALLLLVHTSLELNEEV